jgi:hypothetical protein
MQNAKQKYHNIKIFVVLNEEDKKQVGVYKDYEGIEVFDWTERGDCMNYYEEDEHWAGYGETDDPNTFLIGECFSMSEVMFMLKKFDAHFGTNLVLGDVVSSNVSLLATSKINFRF